VVGIFFDMDAGGSSPNSLIDSLNLEKHNANVTKIPLMEVLRNATKGSTFF
jgi:hypothetical protein